MTKTRAGIAVLACLGFVLGGERASAQESPREVYVDVNAGGQSQSRSLQTTNAFTLFEEQGSFTANHEIGSGFVFDVGGGVSLWRGLGVGVGFSRFNDSAPATVESSLPHPLFFDQPRTVTTSVAAREHADNAVHVAVSWTAPRRGSLAVRIFGGPSFFSVTQDVVTAITAGTEVAPAFPGSVSSTTSTRVKESAVGYNVGVDVSYLFTPQVGAGIFVRQAATTVDLATGIGTVPLDVGGFQFGLGVRFRLPLE